MTWLIAYVAISLFVVWLSADLPLSVRLFLGTFWPPLVGLLVAVLAFNLIDDLSDIEDLDEPI